MLTDLALRASLFDMSASTPAAASPVAIVVNDSIGVQRTVCVSGMSLLSIVTCAVPGGKDPAAPAATTSMRRWQGRSRRVPTRQQIGSTQAHLVHWGIWSVLDCNNVTGPAGLGGESVISRHTRLFTPGASRQETNAPVWKSRRRSHDKQNVIQVSTGARRTDTVMVIDLIYEITAKNISAGGCRDDGGEPRRAVPGAEFRLHRNQARRNVAEDV
ncbi:hypothetical protein I553_4839 [Mycobacterium xenopi 4042]|uniref:Uncharacterized protein n=1 Tax=Mycobacterium xenopi 4042 TaxID=1299334 RepID=X8AF86_MYCXE|nr:hypothetical protein I553_4839 [Mycobacterium xenopi 4042]